MKREKSAGAVIFREAEGEMLFLVLLYEAGHWGFVKGHVEEDEVEKETVLRECEEETGISELKFVPGFREEVRYTYKAGGVVRDKTIVFYLAGTDIGEVELSFEHEGFEWLPYDEARGKLTYEDQREVLDEAVDHLQAHDDRLDKYF